MRDRQMRGTAGGSFLNDDTKRWGAPLLSIAPRRDGMADQLVARQELLAEVAIECEAAYRRRNPESAALAAAAAKVMPGGNTRSSLWFDPFPLYMVSGEGARLRDADGHQYVDFLGEFTSGIAGHSPEPLKRAIRDALDGGINLSAHNMLEGQFAAELTARIPSMEQVRFANSGTEANIMAIMAARFHTGRDRVLVFAGSYHGGGLMIGAEPDRSNLPFQLVVGRYNDLVSARALAEQHRGKLACIIAEPMQGAGGCVPGDPDFLRGLRDVADAAGALLVFDEVQTSRLAVGGRQSQLGIRPDLTTIGKFYGGGLAFGAFGGRADVMAIFDPRLGNGLPHSGTFNNNIVTMAAGLAAIREVLTPAALDALNARGDRLRGDLARLFTETGAPYRISGLGSLMNIHPLATGTTGNALRKLLHFDLLERGIYIASRGLIALSLPLTDEDVAGLITQLGELFAQRAGLYRELAIG
jgi:glutamate-1-semialdehyde 2,1-aminomutase